MTLRRLPDLDDKSAMARLGRLSALRSARLDAVHALRDAVTRLQSAQCDDAAEIAAAREALERIAVVCILEDAESERANGVGNDY